MLQRISKIKNVGVFKEYSLDEEKHGNVKFSKTNIVYGENSSGKSTLVGILKSIRNNDSEIIEGRLSIGNTNKPSIELLINDTNYLFDNNWNKLYPKISIFDQDYINENIFIGDEVSTGIRRNQFNTMIGKENISINRELNDINKKIRDITKDKKVIENNLKSKFQGNIILDDMIKLSDNIDSKTVENKLENLLKDRENYNEKSKINNLRFLKELELPNFDFITFRQILNNNSEDLLSTTEEQVKSHLDKYNLHLSWIELGLNKSKDNVCPFCNQSLDNSDMFQAYKDYFNINLKDYNNKIKQFQNIVINNYSRNHALEKNLQLERNKNSFSDIQKQLNMGDIYHIESDLIGDMIMELYNGVVLLMDKKLNNPLNSIDCNVEIDNLKNKYEELIEFEERYNLEVNTINRAIDEYKDNLETINIRVIENEIVYYKNILVLKDKYTVESIYILKELNNKLVDFEERKAELKSDINRINNMNFGNFNRVLNDILSKLKASFKVSYIYPKFNSYGTEASYNIIIGETRLKSKVSKKELLNTPNFKNTLSGGERNLLALAYFLTTLKVNSEQDRHIIIFDDPTNYCDVLNKTFIAEQLAELSNDNNQIIILTHDIEFSKKFWELNLYNGVTGLYIVANDESSEIITRDVYKQRIM